MIPYPGSITILFIVICFTQCALAPLGRFKAVQRIAETVGILYVFIHIFRGSLVSAVNPIKNQSQDYLIEYSTANSVQRIWLIWLTRAYYQPTHTHAHTSQSVLWHIHVYAHAHTEAAADFSEIYKLSIIYSPAKLYGKRAVNWQ